MYGDIYSLLGKDWSEANQKRLLQLRAFLLRCDPLRLQLGMDHWCLPPVERHFQCWALWRRCHSQSSMRDRVDCNRTYACTCSKSFGIPTWWKRKSIMKKLLSDGVNRDSVGNSWLNHITNWNPVAQLAPFKYWGLKWISVSSSFGFEILPILT